MSSASATFKEWENKEFTSSIQMHILRLSEFLNRFDVSTRHRLAVLNEKLVKLERSLDVVEANLRNSGALPGEPIPKPFEPSEIKTGIHIETIQAGDGRTFPNAGQEVTIHYTGCFTDGREFDSTRGHGNDPFTFILGQGHVVKGWDIAVAKMSFGERIKLYVAADHGYGEKGFGNTIPPNATLVFDIELLKIK
eukprot:GILI01003457.1.p1 GENE.GILI01003457.1~~GILI01003457.1.p1  ORF type:complete len:194 (-),score=33.32 GILI01003457.1:109-690(-)